MGARVVAVRAWELFFQDVWSQMQTFALAYSSSFSLFTYDSQQSLIVRSGSKASFFEIRFWRRIWRLLERLRLAFGSLLRSLEHVSGRILRTFWEAECALRDFLIFEGCPERNHYFQYVMRSLSRAKIGFMGTS